MNPWPLDEVPRPKDGKLTLNLHGTILEGKSISSNTKKDLKGGLMIWRTKMQGRVWGKAQLKNSVLLQKSPNWL
jgi:hypothetical protein